jgi:LAO/AO transport system kinase
MGSLFPPTSAALCSQGAASMSLNPLDTADAGLLQGIVHGNAPVQRRSWPRPSRCWNPPAPTTAPVRTRCSTPCCRTAAARCAWASAACRAWARAPSSKRWACILIEQGHRVAVLAVDPSSSISGGSILGDKTRMERSEHGHPQAYIRPSPSSGTLGGVAEKTREAMLVCEAAGHDVVIVETVGVGQSETAVAGMTDMFVLLQLPNAGDDLQAIKKGVMELADLVVINKADLDEAAAMRARAQISSSLRLHRHARQPRPPAPRPAGLAP